MQSVSPVWTEAEVESERVIALDQPEYHPIVVLRAQYNNADGEQKAVATVTRFRFTEAEKALIAAGADLLISQPHHGPLMPLALELAMPGEYPLPA